MPIDVSSYKQQLPQGQQFDYGALLNRGLQFEQRILQNEQRDLAIQQKLQEQAKQRAHSELISNSVDKAGNVNWNYLTKGAASNPLLADLAPAYAKTAIEQQKQQMELAEQQRKIQAQRTFAELIPKHTKDNAIDWNGIVLDSAKNPYTAPMTLDLLKKIQEANLGDARLIEQNLKNEQSKMQVFAKSIAGILAAAPRSPNGQPQVDLTSIARVINSPEMKPFISPTQGAEILANAAKMSQGELTTWLTQTGVQSLNASEVMKLAFPEARKPSALEEKIETFIESLRDTNLSPGEKLRIAQGVESGRYKVQQDPETKDWSIIDTAAAIAGKPALVKVLPRENTSSSPLENHSNSNSNANIPVSPNYLSPSQNLYGEASKGTGLMPALAEAYRRIIPQGESIPGGSSIVSGADALLNAAGLPKMSNIGSDAIKQRQALNMAERQFVDMMTINNRNPTYEQKLIKDYGIEPSIWQSQKALQDRMVEIAAKGRIDIRNSIDALNDPDTPAKTRAELRQRIRAITNYLKALNVPEEALSNYNNPSDKSSRPNLSREDAQKILRSMGETW